MEKEKLELEEIENIDDSIEEIEEGLRESNKNNFEKNAIKQRKNWLLHYDLIVSQNQILVRSITNEEVKKWWKLSEWESYRKNVSFRILDKDYWKSAELMRYILEDWDTKNNSIKFYIILWVLAFVLLATWFIVIFWWEKEVEQNNVDVSEVQENLFEELAEPKGQNTLILWEEITWSWEIESESKILEEQKIEQQKAQLENVAKLQNQFQLQELQIEIQKKQSQIDIANAEKISMRSELDFQKLENAKLIEKNNRLLIENENFRQKIIEAEEKIVENVRNSNKCTIEGSKLEIYNNVSNVCKKQVSIAPDNEFYYICTNF